MRRSMNWTAHGRPFRVTLANRFEKVAAAISVGTPCSMRVMNDQGVLTLIRNAHFNIARG
jgi:hypothetical protein